MVWREDTDNSDEGHYEHGKNHFIASNKTVVALGCAVAFGVLALVGVAYYFNPTDLNYARLWRDQRWIKELCSVADVGVAYRGNCHMDVQIMMTQYNKFEECEGPTESGRQAQLVREAWDDTAAGECADQGDQDYLLDTGHSVRPGETAEELEKEAEDSRRLTNHDVGSADSSWRAWPSVTALRRRLGFTGPVIMNLPNRLDCHNSYLMWAVMRVPNSTLDRLNNVSKGSSRFMKRCSYEFGSSAPSITGDWKVLKHQKDQLEAAMKSGAKVPCWILADDGCVVAFHDERILTDEKSSESFQIEVSGALCGVGWLISLMLSAYWYLEDLGWIHPHHSRGYHWYHHALPTAEPRSRTTDVQLSDRVRHIMGVAGARFGETTPDASGQSTLRTEVSGGDQDTVQILGPDGIRKAVPKNVAADFLAERPA